MARWKKITLIITGGIAVCAAGAYFFRFFLAGLAIELTIGDFDLAKAPPAPDYAQASAWAALPEKDDASDRVPSGFTEEANPFRDLVDVFYVHPTGFSGISNWNAPAGEEEGLGIPTSVMLAAQASAFNGCGRIYAPRYRQANLLAFAAPLFAPQRKDAYQALDLAYDDVARAFDYFIEHYSQGRPFIIASHSQGSHHVLRLLGEKIDGTPLYPRLIAAYAIGYGIPMDYFGRVFHDVAPCQSPEQTGCLITWDTAREGTRFHLPRTHRYPTGWEYSGGKPRFCINPLTWTPSTERAPATAHAGALMVKMAPESVNTDRCELLGISKAHTWAQIHDGLLWIANQSGTPFDAPFGVYHLYDMNLFWANIRGNARTRAEAYLRAHAVIPTSDLQNTEKAAGK